ncbi:Rtf2 RING-finger-domain-containing protein [Xylaria intraflava]|nr:Rtf2 RING-finger-domain-containing protein [Xylaria intraflava]
MGNDGGSIPKRRELVKEAARLPTASELKATALESLTHAWSTCPISSEPLDHNNTVSDWRGRLYNYETVLRCLMPEADANGSPDERQSQEATEFARSGIRSLKDVVKLRFAMRKVDQRGEVRTCPLSMKELGAATRAVYVVPCGHVFAEIAMKELLAASMNGDADAASEKTKNCPECSETFEDRDIVPVLPVDESDVDKCAARIEGLQTLGLTHNLKKDKGAGGKMKKKKRRAGEEEDSGDIRENGAQREKKQKKDRDDISSRINNSMTATLTAKVLAEQDRRNKERKLAAAVR